MCSYGVDKDLEETYCKIEEVEAEVVQPIVHVRTKRVTHYVKHEIPTLVTKKETHVYYHYYEYNVKEAFINTSEHVYVDKDGKYE